MTAISFVFIKHQINLLITDNIKVIYTLYLVEAHVKVFSPRIYICMNTNWDPMFGYFKNMNLNICHNMHSV